VKVPCSEGLANHTGPESCVSHREARLEALTGERTGQPLNRERLTIQGADAVVAAEGHTTRRATASDWPTRRGLRPWHVRTLFAREPGDLLLDHYTSGVVRIGKVRSRSR